MTRANGLFRVGAIFAAIFAFYLYTEGENRQAIRTVDSSRCWYIFTGSACSSQVAAAAADRLSRT